jgi:hypothetical protein
MKIKEVYVNDTLVGEAVTWSLFTSCLRQRA